MCTSPITLSKNLDKNLYPLGLEVPCGKCLDCRIKKRSEWSMRMLHEKEYWKKSCFLTLTYNDQHIKYGAKGYPTLIKRDLQLYVKRLRKNIGDQKIKYYACGEYGEETQRPHYHAIIFGLSIADTKIMDATWQKGHIKVGLAEADSIRYVAQYIDKKYTGELAEEEYKLKDREPVFRLISQGIGLRYCVDNKDMLVRDKHLSHKGITRSLPRYYCNKLDIPIDDLREIAIHQNCESNERKTGIYITSDDLYLSGETELNVMMLKKQAEQRVQKNRNLIAKRDLKSKKL